MRRQALVHLKRADPVMERVISLVGPCRFAVHSEGTEFNYLARSIIYQQLSGKAAATIYGRVLALTGRPQLAPRSLMALTDAQLRAAGLSRQKTAYLRDLAEHAVRRRLPIERLAERSDDELHAMLQQVTGIGVWTVQMFLMFRLGRPDILPVSDLGVRKGVQIAYGLRGLPPPTRVEKIGSRWAPYRTIASWYLWRLLDVKASGARPA